MTQLTYYDDGAPDWSWWQRPAVTLPEDRDRIGVRHGYSLGDLDRLVRIVMSRSSGVRLFSRAERYETAFEAIAVALCEADDPPDARDLIQAGQTAHRTEARRYNQAHGVPADRRDGTGDTHANFMRYWSAAAGPTPPAEERLLERVALTQIWRHLNEAEQAALTAVALTGTRAAAATALGITLAALNARMILARKRAFRLWFDHEAHPPVPTDRRVGNYSKPTPTQCRRGHPYQAGSFKDEYNPTTRRTSRKCLECKHLWEQANRDKRSAGKRAHAAKKRTTP